MPGEGIEIAINILHIDSKMRHRLRPINHDKSATLFCKGSKVLNGINCSKNI